MSAILPPTYDRTGRHGLTPEVTHDDAARFNFLTNLNVYLGQRVFPGIKQAFEKRVKPKHLARTGVDFTSHRDIRDEMRADPYYQAWAALRVNTMEMRQQAGRHVVLRQYDAMTEKIRAANAGKNTLQLDDKVTVPEYLSQVDNHWMPGSYYGEIVPGDAGAVASYEVGLFVTTAGSMSAFGDGAGRAIVKFVKERFPNFQPKRILDLGGAFGINSLPLAAAFPDAELVVMDVGAPALRYGHARAQSMGYTNVQFVQANGEHTNFPAESFDWIQTTMTLHETSANAVVNILKECQRLLKPGGLMLHLEQPNFAPETPLWERFTRDWDAWYNNEPFWAKFHTMNVFDLMADAGFARDTHFDGRAKADIEAGRYQPWAGTLSRHSPEQKAAMSQQESARKGEGWYLFGATKST
ncbi:MAG: class I SAM-dependent methyltransferase [Rhodospirillaceae bacterium]|nr:class I SAM-dependent methyltransferase [Rhodospirillaceae bacterium]